jgi:hypothetical protein
MPSTPKLSHIIADILVFSIVEIIDILDSRLLAEPGIA